MRRRQSSAGGDVPGRSCRVVLGRDPIPTAAAARIRVAVAIGVVQEQLVRDGLMRKDELDGHAWYATSTLDDEGLEVVTVFCKAIPNYASALPPTLKRSSEQP